jgi:teichuronic acid exporter
MMDKSSAVLDAESGLTRVAAVPLRADTGLDVSLVRGIAWTSSMKWFSQAMTWICTIAVARLLTPADYGLVGMALLYMELVTLINELGLGAAVVRNHTLSSNQVAQLNSLSVLLGAAGVVVSCAGAIPLSNFFGVGELRWVVMVMSASCVITAFRAVPSALLERELQFRTLAIVEAMQAVAGAVIVLVLAWLGLRHWALVFGLVASRLIWTGLVLARRRHAFAWPRLRELADTLTFGWHLLVSRLSWYAQANGDYMVAGRVFGKELLGAYSMSFTISRVPTEKLTSIASRVAFPLFSAVQNDAAALRRYLLGLTRCLSLITFPLGVGLALVADDFIIAVLGEKWRAAILPMRCLALLVLIQTVFPMLVQLLNVIGQSRYVMRVGVAAGIVMPAAFIVGSYWGIGGIAAVWVTVYPMTTIPLYRRAFAKLDLTAGAYLAALRPALTASLVMGAIVWAVRQATPYDAPASARLGVQILGGGVAYVLVVVTLYRDHLQSFRRAVQMMRSGVPT